MRRFEIPGGWYCDARPDGRYVALVSGVGLLTDRTAIALPPYVAPQRPSDLLHVRLANDGRFAGVGHDGHVWEWNGRWVNHGPFCGNYAVIYDAIDQLHIVRDCIDPTDGGTGSLGWWCAGDDGLVPTWECYDPSTPRSIAQGISFWLWSKLGDVVVGQGADGVLARVGTKIVRLGRGSTTHVHLSRAGNDIAVAWVREKPNPAACFLWATVNELRALLADGPDVPAPQPPPPSPPPPERPPVDIPNCHLLVARARANYQAPLGPLHGACLIDIVRTINAELPADVVREHGFAGLFRKPDDNSVTLPDGARVSKDIILFRQSGRVFDCLEDSEGAARPTWGPAGPTGIEPNPAAKFYAVDAGLPPPDDEDDDEQEPPPDGDKLDRVLAILARHFR